MFGTRVAHMLVLSAAVGFLAACRANPASPPGDQGSDLTVELEISADHIHILQTEVEFSVRVRDGQGQPVTDFVEIQLERLLEGTDTWRGIELTLQGDAYRGSYTFASSGAYHLRLMGQRHGDAAMRLLYQAHDPMHVARAHMSAGGYRVEFESFPGHIHEGEAAALRFWVMEPEPDASGTRPPVTGLTAQIHCLGAAAGEEYHAASETGGVYEAEHTFAEAEETHVGIHFTGADGQPAEAEFHLYIAHGH